MSTINRLVQKPFPGVEVDMYDIDLSIKGGPVKYFTNWVREDDTKIVWQTHTYEPVAMQVSGFGTDGSGRIVRPKMKIGNSITDGSVPGGTISGIAAQYDNFIGCEIRKWRTYRQFLDDGESADPNTYFPVDIFTVQTLLEEGPLTMEWELSIPMDQRGNMTPSRIMTQKYCPWTYRQWDAAAGQFDYSKAVCPYVGANMYDEQGNSTADPTKDKCSKRIDSGCRLRFGTTQPLPIGAFPGMIRMTGRN